MICCDNEDLIDVTAQCNDRCSIGGEDPDYLHRKWGIGEGDCIDFTYCANCGKIKGDFPLDI
jgi:hypothetical protein